jgi:RimJ/RimL family protein N-acetyltransferase
VNHPADYREQNHASYEVKSCVPPALTPDEMKKCITIIGHGGAVNLRTMKRDLPGSRILAIARYGNTIVAVGSVKPVRKEYATGIAVKSGYCFPDETPELGYVSVEPAHQGRGLSHEITKLLLSEHQGRLFATTDNPRMKKTLADAGFQREGKEWKGERGILSFWERK